MKVLYHLLFYKLFKGASLVRGKHDASYTASFVMGFLFAFALNHLLYLVKYNKYIPEIFIIMTYIISIILNIVYFMKKHRYEDVINEIKLKKVPVFYHVVIYAFLTLSIVGAFFV